jgi:hypothetical protein
MMISYTMKIYGVCLQSVTGFWLAPFCLLPGRPSPAAGRVSSPAPRFWQTPGTSLARFSLYNRTYVSTLFKNTIGINFYEYLTRIHIQKALLELSSTSKSLTE